ncbi:MAG: CopG family transcriptional regulator [Chloroflexota bacterium]|nr:CopG family transcriptional regulator [Chloroflexota bacterium]
MRRLQIYIDDDMDELLAVEARREGRSKAALIRAAVREQYSEYSTEDSLDDWVGSVDVEPADIDAVVYDE